MENSSPSNTDRVLTYANGTTCERGGTKANYFKVEPIKWRVLKEDYNEKGENLLLAMSALEKEQFYDLYDDANRTIGGNIIYATNWEYSRLRAYMNGLKYIGPDGENKDYESKGFLQTAFTSTAMDLIAVTQLDNSKTTSIDTRNEFERYWEDGYEGSETEDKVFALSMRDFTTKDYGFSDDKDAKGLNCGRVIMPSDYGVARGIWYGYDATQGCYWWGRSNIGSENRVQGIHFTGDANCGSSVASSEDGVVPAIAVKASKK